MFLLAEWMFTIAVALVAVVIVLEVLEKRYGIAVTLAFASIALHVAEYVIGYASLISLIVTGGLLTLLIILMVVELVIERKKRNDGSD